MALFARLEAQAANGPKVSIRWGFYDPAGPFEQDGITPLILHRAIFDYEPGADLIERMTADVLGLGARIVKSRTASASLAQNVPVGTELQVG